MTPSTVLAPHVGAHRQHPFQRQRHRLLVARGQQVGEILHRDAQRLHVGHFAVEPDLAGGCGRGWIGDSGGTYQTIGSVRYSGCSGNATFHSIAIFQIGEALAASSQACGMPCRSRLGDDLGIVGIEEDVELRLVEIALVGLAGGFLDPVGVIEHHAEIADAADAGLRAHRRLAGLDARIAEDALLGFARRPVVIDLLVGAAGDAHAPAAALVLVDQDDAVLLALVDRARRTGRDAGRIEAVLAQPRQVHHEGVFELAVDLLLHALEIAVLRALGELAAEDLLPVRAPFDLLHPLAR